MALSMLEHQSVAAFVFNSLNPCVSGFSLKWSNSFVLITISQMSRGRRREAGQETWILILVLGAPRNPFVLVSWGCWNTAPHAGWLEATEIHSLIALSQIKGFSSVGPSWRLRGQLCASFLAPPASVALLVLWRCHSISASVDTWSSPCVCVCVFAHFL